MSHIRTTIRELMDAARRSCLGMARDTSFDRFRDTMPEQPVKGKLLAPLNLRAKSRHFFTEETYLRDSNRADWQQVDYNLKIFAARFVETARKQLVPLYVHTAFRSPAVQIDMVNKGRSKTRPPIAAHCQGFAVDIVHSAHAWNMSKAEWLYLSTIGKEVARKMGLDVEWGGDWSFYDPAHWQLANWRNRPDLKTTITVGAPVHRSTTRIANENKGA